MSKVYVSKQDLNIEDYQKIKEKFFNNKLSKTEISLDFSHYIVKEFNAYNFGEYDLFKSYSKSTTKAEFVAKNLETIKNIFLNNPYNKRLKEQINNSNYLEITLNEAVDRRLSVFYNAFISEEFKQLHTLKILKENGIKAYILSNREIDKKIGIDFIVVAERLPIYFHSINGSENSLKYLYKKIDRETYLNNQRVNKRYIYTKHNHKIMKDFDGNYYYHLEMRKQKVNEYNQLVYDNIDSQSEHLVEQIKNKSSEEKETATEEFEKIKSLIDGEQVTATFLKS